MQRWLRPTPVWSPSWRSNGHTVGHTRGLKNLKRKSVESYGMLRIIRSRRSMSIRTHTHTSCGLKKRSFDLQGLSKYDVLDLNNKVSITDLQLWNMLKPLHLSLSFFIYSLFIVEVASADGVPLLAPSGDWQTIASLCEFHRISLRHFSIDLLKGWACDSWARDLSCQPANWTEFPQAWSMKQYCIIILIWYTVKIFADLGSILKYSFFSALDPDIWYMYIT